MLWGIQNSGRRFSMRAALYLRVSTDKQQTDNQRLELEAAAAARGWTVVERYADNGISGSKGRDKRPGLDAMLKAAVKRRFDVLMAWSVDRLGRSLPDLIGTMQELASAKVNLFLLQQGLDTTTASGRAMFGMLSVFAEFERAIIVERVNAGLARAKAEQDAGIKRYQRDGRLKKPHGRQRTPVENRIREHLASGMSIRQVQRETGAGSGTVQRIKREMAEAPAN